MSIKLTQHLVHKHLFYEPDTGIFTRLTSNGDRWKVGMRAGCFDKSTGYIKISLLGNKTFAHRLAFLYMNGSFPVDQVDHINGHRADNAFSNLRQCTDAQNKQNLSIRIDNTIGFTGVNKRPSGYVVKFGKKYIGIFRTIKEAHAAYLKQKAICHKFQPVPRHLCQQ